MTIQGVLETSHLLHERMKAEEAAQVQVLTVVHIVSVEGEYTGFAHIEPGTLQHPDLNGEVSDKDLLGARVPDLTSISLHPPSGRRSMMSARTSTP